MGTKGKGQGLDALRPIDKVRAIRDELSQVLYESHDTIDLVLVALLSKSHVCLLGKPGAAKSMAVLELTKRVQGLRTFVRLLTRTTVPEEIFGAVRLSELRNDRFVRNVKGKLPDVEVAFVDEVFKANSAILNSMLTIMNERRYDNDGTAIQVPLSSMFGASNEMPQEEGLAALWDRFQLRHVVPYMTDDDSYRALWAIRAGRSTPPGHTTTMPYSDLVVAQAEVENVALPAGIVGALVNLRRALLKAGIELSPRRWSDTIPVLQAAAWLRSANADAHPEVSLDDLQVLRFMLWTDPSQRAAVRKAINQVSCPPMEAAMEQFDASALAWAEYQGVGAGDRAAKGTELAPRLKKTAETLDGLVKHLVAEGRSVQDLPGRAGLVRGWYRSLITELMGE